MTEFKYFKARKNFKSYPLAYTIIAREKLIIDSRFLPVIEAAEEGDYLALVELQNAFAFGEKGIPEHYNMARYYSNIVLKETLTCPVLKECPYLHFEALRSSAYLEFNYNNLDRAKSEIIKAVEIMKHCVPKDKWDLHSIGLMHFLINDQ